MTSTTRSGLMEKPMSVEAIVKAASDPYFDSHFSMDNWFRTASLMLKQASIYEHEGDDQMAYFLLYRHANLILDDLAKHPNARDPEYRQAWSEARKAVKRSLAKLEILKPRINKRYERYEERRRALGARAGPGSPRDGSPRAGEFLVEGIRRVSLDTPGYRNASLARLDADEHRDMAVELANREIRRRAQLDAHQGVHTNDTRDVSSRMVEARRQVDSASRHANMNGPETRVPSNSTYNYPQVPEKSKLSTIGRFPGESAPGQSFASLNSPHIPPTLPPKKTLAGDISSPTSATSKYPPPLPSKAPVRPSSPSPAARSTASTPTPPPTRQFAATSHLESGSPLRTIFLPTPLRHRFLAVARQNTASNLETCGILCGTLIQNAFFITKLVIPEQTATSDTCEMLNEAALYEYCDSAPGGAELMVLGWIHTHPSQTCFMSSRDLHTHVWYQVQLPESIAIVCAPSKDPDWGIFRLTDPPGMQCIRTCTLPGLFHPHSERHIFTDALGRPGHVIEHEALQFEVVDLRPKR